jgi:TPR repeat protein
MKTLRLILVGAVIAEFALLCSAHAQIYNPRRYTRRMGPQGQNPYQQQATNAQAQVAPAPPPDAAPVTTGPTPANATPRASTQTVVRPPIDPEVAKASREQANKKALEFQKKKAEEGSESAQYELGMRYLKGDGVEKDEATARRWLTMSSKNGYSAATRRLEELDKAAAGGATATAAVAPASSPDSKPAKEEK